MPFVVPPPVVSEALVQMSLENILRSRSPSTNLFDRQVRDKKWSRTLGTEDITSTAICLVALHRYDAGYTQEVVDVDQTLDSLIVRYRTERYSGALGLIFWANAVWSFLDFENILKRLGIRVPEFQAKVPLLTTMEIAWLLSGLLHERKRTDSGEVKNLAHACETALLSRYSGEGRLFWHASGNAGWKHRIRRGVANFADQIYTVHALAMSSMLNGNGSAGSSVALSCIDRLCMLQGDLGQWWWHYSPEKGEVLQHYPVYSVHQHGMAPMALVSAGLIGGRSFADRIQKSISWISDNETKKSLVDVEAGTVWRNIDHALSGVGRFMRSARSFSGRSTTPDGHRHPLEVNHETRPYEWGWLLYAFALATRKPAEGHIV